MHATMTTPPLSLRPAVGFGLCPQHPSLLFSHPSSPTRLTRPPSDVPMRRALRSVCVLSRHPCCTIAVELAVISEGETKRAPHAAMLLTSLQHMDNCDSVSGQKLVQQNGVIEGWDTQKECVLVVLLILPSTDKHLYSKHRIWLHVYIP